MSKISKALGTRHNVVLQCNGEIRRFPEMMLENLLRYLSRGRAAEYGAPFVSAEAIHSIIQGAPPHQDNTSAHRMTLIRAFGDLTQP